MSSNHLISQATKSFVNALDLLNHKTFKGQRPLILHGEAQGGLYTVIENQYIREISKLKW